LYICTKVQYIYYEKKY